MPGCCDPRGCDRFFGSRFAGRVAKRYRKRGARRTIGHARTALVFSHPPRNLASRLVVAAQNLGFRLTCNEFRTFAHPPSAMLAVLEDSGLRCTYTWRGVAWRVAGLERPA